VRARNACLKKRAPIDSPEHCCVYEKDYVSGRCNPEVNVKAGTAISGMGKEGEHRILMAKGALKKKGL